MSEKVFVTGASGCIGYYVLERLLDDSSLDIHVLIRSPEKFPDRFRLNPRITVHQGELEQIALVRDVIAQSHYIIHIATVWNNSDHADFINRDKTHELFSYCDPSLLKRIVYFSTASILGPGNQAVDAAEKYGSGYVRSKYLAYRSLPESPVYSKIVTVFPTLVFGGDETHIYSHISQGLVPNRKYLKLLRFLNADAAFHFLHGKDIAAVSVYLLLNPVSKNEYVLGNEKITFKQAVDVLCRLFGIRRYFYVTITPSFVFFLCKWLRIEIGAWERYCISHAQMVYDTVNPATFGLKTAFPTLDSVIEDLIGGDALKPPV